MLAAADGLAAYRVGCRRSALFGRYLLWSKTAKTPGATVAVAEALTMLRLIVGGQKAPCSGVCGDSIRAISSEFRSADTVTRPAQAKPIARGATLRSR